MKIILLSVFFTLLLLSCGKNYNAEIRGQILDTEKTTIHLEQLNVDKSVIVDSIKMDRDGKFHFKFHIEHPCFYALRTGKESAILFIKPGDEIDLKGRYNGFSNNYALIGSNDSDLIWQLNKQQKKSTTTLDSIQKAYAKLPEEKQFDIQRQALQADWDSTIVRQIHFSKEFILKNAISPASYYALYQKFPNNTYILDPVNEYLSYRIVASSMSAMYPESQFTKALMAHFQKITQSIRNQNIKNIIDNAEAQLPEINLPDISGKDLSLSSLKGNYIILDFTLLGAAQSENSIKEMQQIYHKFKNKGIKIYQVCLDKNKLLWEELVKTYAITWTCVWDKDNEYSKAASAWNIKEIPSNYIINKGYEIVGKNLYGRRLEDRLNDLLNQ